MKAVTIVAMVVLVVLVAASRPSASGPVGLYGIVERVLFEPDAASPERVQVWGVFAYADGRAAVGSVAGMSTAERGYLYFKLPGAVSGAGSSEVDLARREWADLASLAGTGQAVAFGQWGYIGSFSGLHPAKSGGGPPYIIERAPGGGAFTDMRVRAASEPPAAPATYQTNAGIVTLSDRGSHAAIVAHLRERLAK
jgi:hypothetical protein